MKKIILESKYPFEAYLEEVADKFGVYEGVLDDDMENAFEGWLVELDHEEIIEHANAFGRMLIDSFVVKKPFDVMESLSNLTIRKN